MQRVTELRPFVLLCEFKIVDSLLKHPSEALRIELKGTVRLDHVNDLVVEYVNAAIYMVRNELTWLLCEASNDVVPAAFPYPVRLDDAKSLWLFGLRDQDSS